MESGIIKIDVPEINFGSIPLTSDVRHQPSHIAKHVRPAKNKNSNFAAVETRRGGEKK